MKFILERPAIDWLAPFACACWIPTLNHEILDDSMEDCAIVVTFHAQLNKIPGGLSYTQELRLTCLIWIPREWQKQTYHCLGYGLSEFSVHRALNFATLLRMWTLSFIGILVVPDPYIFYPNSITPNSVICLTLQVHNIVDYILENHCNFFQTILRHFVIALICESRSDLWGRWYLGCLLGP